jgi:ATP-dependent Clp endopeptidase proteolytic subunit ClpP
MFKLPKNTYILAEKTANADDEEETNDIEQINNSIFFYTGVNKTSILNLNKKLKKIANELNYTAHCLDIEVPEIKLHINSDGGSLLDCFSTVDAIRNSKAPVHTIIEGSAASAATLISVVGQRRSINKNSFMLIHQLSGGMWGKFEDMKDDMQNCNVFMERIYEIYGQYAKIPKNTLKDILKRDIYFDAKTCLKYGLVDKIIE